MDAPRSARREASWPSRSCRRVAAIDVEHGAGDVAGGVGGEEQDGGGDLPGLGDPPERDARLDVRDDGGVVERRRGERGPAVCDLRAKRARRSLDGRPAPFRERLGDAQLMPVGIENVEEPLAPRGIGGRCLGV